MRRGSVAWREPTSLANTIASQVCAPAEPDPQNRLPAERKPQLFFLLFAIGLQPSQLHRELLLQLLDLAVVTAHLRLPNLTLQKKLLLRDPCLELRFDLCDLRFLFVG